MSVSNNQDRQVAYDKFNTLGFFCCFFSSGGVILLVFLKEKSKKFLFNNECPLLEKKLIKKVKKGVGRFLVTWYVYHSHLLVKKQQNKKKNYRYCSTLNKFICRSWIFFPRYEMVSTCDQFPHPVFTVPTLWLIDCKSI